MAGNEVVVVGGGGGGGEVVRMWAGVVRLGRGVGGGGRHRGSFGLDHTYDGI